MLDDLDHLKRKLSELLGNLETTNKLLEERRKQQDADTIIQGLLDAVEKKANDNDD